MCVYTRVRLCACICVLTCTHAGKHTLRLNADASRQSPRGLRWGLLILFSYNYIFFPRNNFQLNFCLTRYQVKPI